MPANWMDHAFASVAPRMAVRRVLARQAFQTLMRGYDGASKGRRSARAQAAPMPLEAPVIRAVL